MINCPTCRNDNAEGSIFCIECGAKLIDGNGLVTQHIKIPTKEMQQIPVTPASNKIPTANSNAWGTLHLMETGQVLPLQDRVEFTLGRVSEGQPIMPDIDLSVYKAYAGGVSRLHAVIKREGQRVIVMDLGSSNGTYVNGKRLNPNVEQVVKHGDVITLGKLKMQILIKS